jgi:hypothetical protein
MIRPVSSTAPGWYPDPYQRHESRYWDGGRWTEHVSNGGATAVDPADWGAGASSGVTAPAETAAFEVPPERDPVPPAAPTWQPTPPAPPEPPMATPPPVATPPASWGAPPSNVPPAPPTWGATAPGGAWAATTGRPPVDTRDRLPAIIGLAASAVLLASAFLPWFEVSVDFGGVSVSEDVSGMDGGDGVLIILFALVAGALALLRLLGKGAPQLGIGMAVVGLLATVVGLIDLADKDPDTDAALAQLADVNPSVGLWLVILAGLVVAVAGVLVVVWGRSRRTAA